MDVISVQRRAKRGKLGYCNLITRPLDDCELKTCKQHSRALRRHTAVTDGTHLQPQAAQKIMNRLLKEGWGGTGNHAVTPPLSSFGGRLNKKKREDRREERRGRGRGGDWWTYEASENAARRRHVNCQVSPKNRELKLKHTYLDNAFLGERDSDPCLSNSIFF